MDPEIHAMAEISAALGDLDPDAARRVLRWANERFQLKSTECSTADRATASSQAQADFAEFHELFDAADPQNGPENVLVVGYWFQVLQGHEDLDGFQLNRELKNLGHQSSNITRDIQRLIKRSPRLAMQVKKQGTSRQGKKRYKLTRAGVDKVERMLAATGANGNGEVAEFSAQFDSDD